MGYWTIGSEGRLTSWGSANFYSTLLAAMTTNRATVRIGSDDINITGLNVHQAAYIPGLKRVQVDITAMLGSTPYLGNNGLVSLSTGYDELVQSFEWTASTPTVHDITPFASGGGVEWMSFRPDIFMASATFTAGVDSATALTLPPAPGASLPTLTLQYTTNGTLAASGIIRQVSAGPVRGQKNLAEYSLVGTGAWTAAGAASVFGSRTFGSSANNDPLWTSTGSAVGAMVVQMAPSRTLTLTDSFWERMTLRCSVGAVPTINISVRGTGSVSVA